MPTHFAEKSSNPQQYDSMQNYDSTREHDGFYCFNKDQFYNGEFFRDSFHGEGTYRWKSSGVTYEGGFYANCREGYASLSFPDKSYFEGLFVGNRPFGPGIFTYPNGRQDAGFWVGRRLVRLSRPVDYIIPRLASTSAGKIKLLRFRRLIPVEEDSFSAFDILLKYGHPIESFSNPYSRVIYDHRSIFFDKQAFDKAYFEPCKDLSLEFRCSSPCVRLSGLFGENEEETINEKPVPPHCLCTNNEFEMIYDNQEHPDICDVESRSSNSKDLGILGYFTKYGKLISYERLGSEEGETDPDLLPEECVSKNGEESRMDLSNILRIVSWNRSELCTEMLKQIFRFQDFEGKLNFNLSKLMVGARTAFRKTGEREKQCIHFLKMCSLGPVHEVKNMLCSYDVSEELMDARGNNSLMFAAAGDQRAVMDVLLNYGVDVNAFNDEGLTPLNLCLLRRLALANDISNWETAFLPKETEEIQETNSQTHEYPAQESISSLDRIFGDGMSVAESNVLGLETQDRSPVLSASFDKAICEVVKEGSRNCLPTSSLSKSVGSFSIINWDWDVRIKKSSYSGVLNPTPTLNIKIIPESIKRDEYQRSVRKTKKDKYFFGFNFHKRRIRWREKSFNSVKRGNVDNWPGEEEQNDDDDDDDDEEEEEEEEEEGEEQKEYKNPDWNLDPIERIVEIDKTIEFLLRRGADPNLSEVPRPSIHLGIYTKDLKTVQNLLSYGAKPDSVLHPIEGLLTPLHVIVLRESAPENVDLCSLLLKYKAHPNEETLPEFALYEEEKEYLDPACGRTPLQLLCMRPDLEYADKEGNLIKIALMLAKVCQRKQFYNGHSYLTLAMLLGNVKLLEALLNTKFFDPKAVLGKKRGTCLHVLVSSELQKKTPYETSVKMCDLLLRAGADPLKRFKRPKILRGTCIDYGKREIEAEKKARRSTVESLEIKQTRRSRVEKLEERDYLKDHQRIVDYLAKLAERMGQKKSITEKKKDPAKLGHGKDGKRRKKSSDDISGEEDRDDDKAESAEGEGEDKKASSAEDAGEEGEENGDAGTGEKRKSIIVLENMTERQSQLGSLVADNLEFSSSFLKDLKMSFSQQGKGGNRIGSKGDMEELSWDTTKDKKGNNRKNRNDRDSVSHKNKDRENDSRKNRDSESVPYKNKKDRESLAQKDKKDRESLAHKDKKDRESLAQKDKKDRESLAHKDKKDRESLAHKDKKDRESLAHKDKKDRESLAHKDKKDRENVSKKKGKLRQESENKIGEEDVGRKIKKHSQKDKNYESTDDVKKDRTKKANAPNKKETESSEDKKAKKGIKKVESEEVREQEKRGPGKLSTAILKINAKESNILKAEKSRSSVQNLTERKFSSSEVFPEKLRQILLRLYGNCANMDINEFLMPYVVLRDGDLFYKFKRGATKQKEQYSLV